MEMLMIVVVGSRECSSTIFIILEHPGVKRMQCVQGIDGSGYEKIPLKTPGSQVDERWRYLGLHELGVGDGLLSVGC